MKTPEEIKRGLKQCYTIGVLCDGCPYEKYDECYDQLVHDANTYIEHLEKRASLNTLRDAIYEDAVANGLWDRDYGPTYCAKLILDEASELDSAAIDTSTARMERNAQRCSKSGCARRGNTIIGSMISPTFGDSTATRSTEPTG